MKKNFAGILVSLSIFMSLHAADDELSGAYIGLGLGSTAYVDSDFAKEQIPGVDEEVAASSLGAKLIAGYMFNQIVAMEAAYVYYGNFEVNDNYTYRAQGVSLAANVGYTFISTGLRPYVLLGMGYIFSGFTHDEVIDVPGDNPTLHLGFGLDYRPEAWGGFAIRVAYESNSFLYTIDADTPEEKSYAQGFGLLYLGAGYRF